MEAAHETIFEAIRKQKKALKSTKSNQMSFYFYLFSGTIRRIEKIRQDLREHFSEEERD